LTLRSGDKKVVSNVRFRALKGQNGFFMFKIYSALNGGVDKIMNFPRKESVNLDKNLVYEIKPSRSKMKEL
jgi:hypothetical protein